MGSVFMVVVNVFGKQPFQMGLVHRDHVVTQITSATFDPPLSDSILPRTFDQCSNRANIQGADRSGNLAAEFRVAVKDQESCSSLKRKCFSQLLNHPGTCRMTSHIEVQDLPSVVTDHEKAVKQAKSHRRDSEEIHRRDSFAMVLKKREPPFSRLRISRGASHPSGNRSLGHIEAEHHELTMDSRHAPSQVLDNHSEDQVANLLRDSFPTEHAARF
jgi:hypothetical protein